MRRRQQSLLQSGLRTGDFHLKWRRAWRRISGKRGVLILILMLLVIALAPPLFFHFRLTRLQKTQMKNCGWMRNPPLVCAHGGDSVNAFPNTMAAYRSALLAGADCIEIDVSRSADGFLFALHDRELQRISGNHTSRVGYMSMKEINELDAALHFPKVLDDQKVPTLEDALRLVSHSVRQVILDAKVGPPSYEKGLAENILATVNKTHCTNCIIWAKSDTLVREIIRISPNTMVGYIIMKDPQTRSRSNLLRLKKAGIAGIYHPLINEQLIQILRWGNKKIYAWTVDDLNSMQHMLVDSVDAVVTSNPALLQQLMQNTRIRCLEDGFSLP
ncbi:glycerophosphodiester phosphodiesterase GDPD4 isoform X1 [Amaranthus tricolor]|uniref:glycerophosphodiester phosphodiesterase GDPD4 isoform X1 n=1 Tax=Amaranthus tricolor TaxID=29722 RepID=UPI002584F89B|nr:glycerophosphodiester phosphodiesterase GDPD4 isoform X1 [Amaranthus tricolor]